MSNNVPVALKAQLIDENIRSSKVCMCHSATTGNGKCRKITKGD
jgi:hypothetical protein